MGPTPQAKKEAPTPTGGESTVTDAPKAPVAPTPALTGGAKAAGRGLAVAKAANPPKGAHAPKAVPVSALGVLSAKDKATPGAYVIATPGGRGHHAIVVVPVPGQMATHGGCYQPTRAVYYGRLHAALYGVPLNVTHASEAVKGEAVTE